MPLSEGVWHHIAKPAQNIDEVYQIRYICGLAKAMVGSSCGSSNLADCHPPLGKLGDSLRNAFFGLDSGLFFIPDYRIE